MRIKVRIEKIISGGQGIGTLSDGRKIFAWNVLPGELVVVNVLRAKKNFLDGIAEEIIEPSPDRVVPLDKNFLATSPWQIMNLTLENQFKTEIIQELFHHATIDYSPFEIISDKEWHYRNKMEYSLWGDDNGIQLALHRRGSHQKEIVEGSSLAHEVIDKSAHLIIQSLPKNIRAADLKTIIIRSNQHGDAIGGLYTKDKNFPQISVPKGLQGLEIIYSNPRSPASVKTETLYTLGNNVLHENILGKEFVYSVDSFFQVNVPVYEKALECIKKFVGTDKITDMYSGIGTIGLSVGQSSVELIETENVSVSLAKINAEAINGQAKVIHSASENATDYIKKDRTLIVDPPRAGLHDKVIQRIAEIMPKKIVYLSCNPLTQVRDFLSIQDKYTLKELHVYNFFPKTPHIESLILLERKK
ncbi:MAG: 23S rRNA (uracil(1939)-C(5))-methyltransferase RlmD [Candidatus Saccharimonadales bacterium]